LCRGKVALAKHVEVGIPRWRILHSLRSDRANHRFARTLELGVGDLASAMHPSQIIQGEGFSGLSRSLHPNSNMHHDEPANNDNRNQSENDRADAPDDGARVVCDKSWHSRVHGSEALLRRDAHVVCSVGCDFSRGAGV
jgi:hypothetical protein